MAALARKVAPLRGSPDARTVYELTGVGKTYARNRVHALEGISLSLHRGSFSSVIGSSGCGKSTLLKIMAGLTPPSAGRVTINGEPVMGPRRDIGMMFQQATLFPWRTTLENVLLPIEIRDGKAAARKARDRGAALLKLVGLEGFETVYPNELSGGMAQRAAICRMLVTEPDMILLDEPFSALDEISRDFMNMELQRICMGTNATAFLVTHSIAEAVILSDHVYVLAPRPGRIAEVIEIDLPRPRTLDMITTPRFGALVERIRTRLDKGDF
ncbi:ABC transporter ATP-binding protein [Paracoccus sp. Ld10]|uniref:ABC transporter ATP-binding protein n=1 Tax=Paracoccus sp. Ld10 TaxID=649158 RepID=UPI003866DD42